jgi:hypothetical protein
MKWMMHGTCYMLTYRIAFKLSFVIVVQIPQPYCIIHLCLETKCEVKLVTAEESNVDVVIKF